MWGQYSAWSIIRSISSAGRGCGFRSKNICLTARTSKMVGSPFQGGGVASVGEPEEDMREAKRPVIALRSAIEIALCGAIYGDVVVLASKEVRSLCGG